MEFSKEENSMTNKKSIVAAVFGTALEYYDFGLYMHFIFILTPLFFPNDDPFITKIIGLSTFAIGFLMRPLGGVIFGHLGDRFGRKEALSLSILFSIVPTFVIGILPTYAQIGIVAPIVLLLCRLTQSFSVGGEASGATVFVVEHAKPGSKAMAGSFLNVANSFGAMLGAFLGLLCTLNFMPSWGWRLPFLLGAILGWVGFYIRNKTLETSDFEKTKKQKRSNHIPLVTIIKQYKLNILCLMGLSTGIVVPYYTAYVFISEILVNNIKLTTSQSLGFNTFFLALSILIIPCMGRLGDLWGPKRILLLASSCFILASYPMFWFIDGTTSLYKVAVMQTFLVIIGAGFAGGVHPFISYLFHTSERYSGIALGWSLGVALLGGTAPIICTLLSKWTGDPKSPAYFFMFCGCLSMLSIIKARSIQPAEIQDEAQEEFATKYKMAA